MSRPMREIYHLSEQIKLFEDHMSELASGSESCSDCLWKHVNAMVGYAQEVVTLSETEEMKNFYQKVADQARNWRKAIFEAESNPEILENINPGNPDISRRVGFLTERRVTAPEMRYVIKTKEVGSVFFETYEDAEKWLETLKKHMGEVPYKIEEISSNPGNPGMLEYTIEYEFDGRDGTDFIDVEASTTREAITKFWNWFQRVDPDESYKRKIVSVKHKREIRKGWDRVHDFNNPGNPGPEENEEKKQVYQKMLKYMEEEDAAILTAGTIHKDIKIIHDFYPKQYYKSIDHMGFGFFRGETESGEFTFDGGGAMRRNGWISWTPLRATKEVLKDLKYDREKVARALKELIDKGNNPGIPEHCEFSAEKIKPKKYFDKASFRTLCPESPTRLCKDLPPELACATRIIIGCQEGQFIKGKCRVGTEAHVIYHGTPKPSNPDQITPDLERIRRLHTEAIPDEPGKSIDTRTGKQLDRFWLPETLKKELIAEFKRPEGKKTGIAAIKYFNPTGVGTWWISEYDPEWDTFFGIAIIHEPEYGYTSRMELRDLKLRMGLWIERDYYWTPKTLKQIMKEEQEKRYR